MKFVSKDANKNSATSIFRKNLCTPPPAPTISKKKIKKIK
jgi:hypothetical protein